MEILTLVLPSEGVTEDLYCTHIGDNLYRIESIVAGMEQIGIYDVVEVDREYGERRSIVRVVSRSGWTTGSLTMSTRVRDSSALTAVVKQINDCGGKHELLGGTVLGGLLMWSLPPGVNYDPLVELEKAFSAEK